MDPFTHDATADHEDSYLGSSEYVVPSFLDGLPKPQHNQLLEMLHVPLLHGGVKEAFLFPAFTTSSNASFAFACIILILAACILELIKLVMWRLESRYLAGIGSEDTSSCKCKHSAFQVFSLNTDRKNYNAIDDGPETNAPKDTVTTSAPSKTSPWLGRSSIVMGVGILQLITYVGSTLLMLIAMTMNIYLIISLATGATLGKLISLHIKDRIHSARR